MGIQLNGNNDNISAVDGDLSITGITTFSQLDVGSNIKLGNAGVITATSYRGDGSQLTGISAGVSLSNGADNRVVTATGAAALNGEANLTYDGSHLSIATDASAEGIKITSTGNTYNELSFDANRTSANTHIGRIISHWNGTAVSYISMDAGSDTTNKDDGMIRFWTAADGNGNYERLRIGNAGQLGIAGANYGTSGQVLTSQGSGSAPTWATPSSGLSNVQQWRLTVSGNCSSGSDNILPTDAGTWEAADTVSPGSLGTGMTYASNGIFVFPSTGIWKIDFHGFWGISASDSDAILKSRIYCTTNNSSYSVASQQINSIKSDAQYTYQGWYVTHIFDVTNTSTHKVRFVLNPSGGNTYYKARSDWTETGALFMRLGDT